MNVPFDFSQLPRSSVEAAMQIADRHAKHDPVFFAAIFEAAHDEIDRRDGCRHTRPSLAWRLDTYSGDEIVAHAMTAAVLHNNTVRWVKLQTDPGEYETWAALAMLTGRVYEYFFDAAIDYDQATMSVEFEAGSGDDAT